MNRIEPNPARPTLPLICSYVRRNDDNGISHKYYSWKVPFTSVIVQTCCGSFNQVGVGVGGCCKHGHMAWMLHPYALPLNLIHVLLQVWADHFTLDGPVMASSYTNDVGNS